MVVQVLDDDCLPKEGDRWMMPSPQFFLKAVTASHSAPSAWLNAHINRVFIKYACVICACVLGKGKKYSKEDAFEVGGSLKTNRFTVASKFCHAKTRRNVYIPEGRGCYRTRARHFARWVCPFTSYAQM